uniref:Oxidation resistance protein 1 n=1 Tax=Aegilops tauschii subsp. strangulata TaxID=200361 RepID=A0A453PIX1_AEGTS
AGFCYTGTSRHGISLSTLYRRSLLCPGYSLLVVGDRKGAVFGGLVEAPLQPTSTKKYQRVPITALFSLIYTVILLYTGQQVPISIILCALLTIWH